MGTVTVMQQQDRYMDETSWQTLFEAHKSMGGIVDLISAAGDGPLDEVRGEGLFFLLRKIDYELEQLTLHTQHPSSPPAVPAR